ncbi:hypothetical protein N9C42_02430 [Alphaproteobacteria bacterium]|nr:hypothetical protein [Alphaproteobacteria bacterium]
MSNSQLFSRQASATRGYSRQVLAFKVTVGFIFNSSNIFFIRQKPTLIPYSCQLQFGKSGRSGEPWGGVIIILAIGLTISYTSKARIGQIITLASLGSFRGFLSTIAE